MKQTSVLLAATAVFALTGCAAPVESVRNRTRSVITELASERRAYNDQQFFIWRDLRELEPLYACTLSKGSVARNATPEERAEIEQVKCTN